MLALQAVPVPHSGYGSLLANLQRGLTELGIVHCAPTTLEQYVGLLQDPANHQRTNSTIWIGLPWLAPGKWEGQWIAAFSMWESTQLPEIFCSKLHVYDRLFAPNDHNVELFSQFHADVVKVPLGYDASVWVPMVRQQGSQFRILCAGAGAAIEGGRKGFDLAAKAFEAAFPAWQAMDPSPRLVIKSTHQIEHNAAFVESHVGGQPLCDVVELVASCHAYLGPSRGEGWGYWPQQCVATGIPAVVSAIPAHMEYAHLPGFSTVPVERKRSGYTAFGAGGDWWEPQFDQLVERLRDLHDRYDAWLKAASAGASDLRASLTHRHMAQHLMRHVESGAALGGWQEFEAPRD